VTTAIGNSLNEAFGQAYLGNSQQQQNSLGQGLLGSGGTNYNPAQHTYNPAQHTYNPNK
jgi:hypothetical protein